MKLPAIQFYPGDWHKDSGVQALDLRERGAWFEILLMMHDSDERGVLLVNGHPMPDHVLARRLGLDNQELNQILTSLFNYGVANRRESDGAIISRRMIRDENLRKIRQNAGSMGGNPALLKQKTTTRVKQNPTPSSSSSITDNTPVVPKGTLQLRAEKLFNRRAETPLTDAERRAFRKNKAAIEATSESQWQALERFYAAPQDETFSRKDLSTLINNWNGEIDRAMKWIPGRKAGVRPDLPTTIISAKDETAA